MKDKNTTVMIVLLILAMLGIFYIYQISYAKYKKKMNRYSNQSYYYVCNQIFICFCI